MRFEGEPEKVNTTEETRHKIAKQLESFGVVPDTKLIDHLVVLEEKSEVNDDSRMISEGIKNVLDIESYGLSAIQKKELILAGYLHDVGKAGPSDELDCLLAVVKLFSVKNIKDRETTTVSRIIQTHFLDQELEMVSGLSKIDVSPVDTMFEFHNRHAPWTMSVLRDHSSVGINENIIKIASSHHMDRGINPANVNLETISKELKYSILLLMAMDRYQAFYVRGVENEKKGRVFFDHQESMKALRTALGQYDNDPVIDPIIKTIDQLGASGNLFPEGMALLKKKSEVTSNNIIN